MEEAIQAQTRDRVPEEVTELVLDTCKAAKVTGLEKFSNLKLLTLNGCGLTSLEGFPTLPKLQRLELSDNGRLEVRARGSGPASALWRRSPSPRATT